MVSNFRMIEANRQSRTIRRPQHTFYVSQKPWQIQPMLLAPVLPGETMRNLLLQARVVSDPLANPLIGWWSEFYFFYVKHRDLDNRDDYVNMMLDMAAVPAADTADPKYYHQGGHVNWSLQCLKRITEEYFRNEGEAWNAATIDGLPAASINDSSWLDSATNATDYTAVDVALDTTDDEVTASEIDLAMRQWEFLKSNELTSMSYEDYLRTYGVRPASVELHRPELVRYVRAWTYPTNTVDPATGAPTSAASWAIAERADKDRFFKEPGFLFGVSVVRPKTYRGTQVGAAASLMDSAMAWLPAILSDNPATSMRLVDNGAGSPLEGITDDYVVDLKDLLLYGDQFLNFDPDGVTDINAVGLPSAALGKRYADLADARLLFVDGQGETPANLATNVRMDGVVSLTIASQQRDTSGTV